MSAHPREPSRSAPAPTTVLSAPTGRGVAMLTEGTYPHIHGGVSTWCDQLVRGMPDVDFQVLSLTATGREPVAWELPPNIRRHTAVPLWGVPPGTAHPPLWGVARRRFLASYGSFLDALLDADDQAPDGPAQERFAAGLYELAVLAREGRLSAALRTEAALRTLTDRWATGPSPATRSPAAASPLLATALAPAATPALARALATREATGGGAGRGAGGGEATTAGLTSFLTDPLTDPLADPVADAATPPGDGGDHATRPTLHDALTATDLLEHHLRPLAVRIPDGHIAHAVSGGLAVLPALVAQRLDGTPFLLTEHGVYLRERYLSHRGASFGTPVKRLLLGFHRRLAVEGYRRARLVTPCNQYNRRWEERGGADPDRIRTVYNGVDPQAFPEAGPEPATLTLVWAGRVDPIKDLETLIRAYALLRPAFPTLRLRLFGGVPAGGEEYRDRCAKLAATLGVADGLTFEGRVSQVSRAYAAGSVVMLSSISEGFPYSLIEAMSCGRATVSTDVGGVREAAGDAGLVVPPRDPAAMAEATAALLRDPGRRAALGAAARRRVIDQFALRSLIDNFLGIYDELGTPPRPPHAPDPPAASPPGARPTTAGAREGCPS
ncbi:GT4 family glycosyltransferase PelF [Streptomyces sp. 4N509B]|uniref:GT4 family glycosyltransferase PelF n=1 Tax=Streptomyces sp. 4N509B TaxID=3457413 RepID=UPI003FD62EFD